VATAIPAEATVVDLGSGAGLPGLVLAIGRPDLTVTLVEPLQRRITFLDEVVDALGLERVRTVRGRAEELHGREQFDIVTARALAPLSRLVGWAMPLVAPAGALLAMKGRSAPDEIEAASQELRKLRCAPPELVKVIGADGSSTATLVRVAHADRRG
jgi:16S rRNA (guanine527-N7)-methyltransferase